MSTISLYTLPIELIHHIISNLDIQTTLSSFRNVCKRFYTIVNGYNNYVVDLSSISKIDFHYIFRMIPIENIISLTLSDGDMTPGQINLFMSLFDINQFIRLRSLTLIQIEKFDFNRFIQQMNINSLNSLSINIRKTESITRNIEIIPFLSNHALVNLRKLDISMWSYDINNIIWPHQCTIQYLTIGHYVTFKQICKILSQLLNLRTLIIRNCILDVTDEPKMILSHIEKNTNLTSLTVKDSHLQMNQLELLLPLTPSLINLQLIGTVSSSDTILDGSRWEHFIQTKLPLLQNFVFFLRSKTEKNLNSTNIESLIDKFRTMFWLKEKSWFVTCNYIDKTRTLRLYTIPICDTYLTYESNSDKIVSTTSNDTENETVIMNNVHEIEINLTQTMKTIKTQQITTRTRRLFCHLTALTLIIDEEWPFESNEFLLNLIDLSHLTTLELSVDFTHSSISDTIDNIGYLLKQTNNVHTLILSSHDSTTSIIERICSIIPHYVRHLDLFDIDLDDIKILLERLKHLFSVSFTFSIEMPFSPTEIIEWLSKIRNFTYLDDKRSLSLWLGQIH
ncbi:unnamed protein product [Adineta steineri]|uniref:F-box domain-containing protein n=1 Tax=Adineta steineri TaxID=433720 RepID=A0A818SG96_9BILA|nr:unnamed protein product [Adineta steineri]CAF3669081.1 unnamed protein product [Adineta steineri]